MLFRSPPKFTSPYCYSPPAIQTPTDNNQRAVFANHNHFSSGVKHGNPEKGFTRSFLFEQRAKFECQNISEVEKTLINRNCVSPDRPESFKSYTFSENLSFLKNNQKISQNKDQQTTTKISFNNHKNKEQDFNKDRNIKQTFSRKNTTNSYFSPKSGTHDQRLHSQVLELQRQVCDVQKKYEKIEQNYNFSPKDNLASDGFSKKTKSGQFLEHNNAWEIKNREVQKENTILREKIRELDESSSKFFQKKNAFQGNNLSTTLENCSSTKSRVDTDISIIQDFSVNNKKPQNKQLEFSKKNKKDQSELTKVSGLYEQSRRELLKIMKEVDNIRKQNTYLIAKLRRTEQSLDDEKKKSKQMHFDLDDIEIRLENMTKNEIDLLQRENDYKQKAEELTYIIKRLQKQSQQDSNKILKMELLQNQNKSLLQKNQKAEGREKAYLLQKKEMQNRINEKIKSMEKQNEIISKGIENENILKIKLLQQKIELLTKESNMKSQQLAKVTDSKKAIQKQLFKTKKVISDQLNEVQALNLLHKQEKQKLKQQKIQYKTQIQQQYQNKITQIINDHKTQSQAKQNLNNNIMLQEYQKILIQNQQFKEQIIKIKNKSEQFAQINQNLNKQINKLEITLSNILEKVNEMHSKEKTIQNDENNITQELAKLTNLITPALSNTHQQQILLLQHKIQQLNQQLLLSQNKIQSLTSNIQILTQQQNSITLTHHQENSSEIIAHSKDQPMAQIHKNEEPQPVDLRESKRSTRSEQIGDYIEIDKNALLYICDILSITPKQGQLLKTIIDFLQDNFIPELQNNYKQVLELFGVQTEVKRQTHRKLMSEIKDFRISLKNVLQKVGGIQNRREIIQKDNHRLGKHAIKLQGILNKMQNTIKQQNQIIITNQIKNLNLSIFQKYSNLL